MLIVTQCLFSFRMFDESFLIFFIIIQPIYSILMWATIHEGIHHNLFKNSVANNLCSRLIAIIFGSNYLGLKYAHLSHHKYNRTQIERPDIKISNQNNLLRGLSFYFHILGGIYIKELIFPCLILLPKKILLIINRQFKETSIEYKVGKSILEDQAFNSYRWDSLFIYTYIYVSAFLFYKNGNLDLFITFYILRALVISLHDYSYHYGTNVDNILSAKNLRIPLSFFILHFNYHGTHHMNPSVPWYRLPAMTNKTSKETFFWGILKQFKGLLNLEDLK